MKKFSILLAGLAFTVGFGQVGELSQALDQQIISTEGTTDACGVDIADDNYWGGAINATKYASVLPMDPGSAFHPESLNLLIGVYEDESYTVDEKEFIFNIYDDDGSFYPNNAISTYTTTPSAAEFVQAINLTSGAVVYVYDVTFDLNGMPAANLVGFDNWFGIEMAVDDGIQVGLNFTLSATGYTYYYEEGFWTLFNSSAPDAISFVYTLTGDCTEMGVNDMEKSTVSVYPNPVKDILNISTKNVDVKEVTVLSLSGQVVASSKSNSVNLSSLPAGVYVVKVVDAKGNVTTSKVVKK
ncbi:T9SS type A sorting domain-containing protein [Moheibacter sp.]|uniref:T9SS type A sorting domain-containing protein n=1 Tax=Moheibacter sp. TaxID=1965316 RepID=UPI003C78704F